MLWNSTFAREIRQIHKTLVTSKITRNSTPISIDSSASATILEAWKQTRETKTEEQQASSTSVHAAFLVDLNRGRQADKSSVFNAQQSCTGKN